MVGLTGRWDDLLIREYDLVDPSPLLFLAGFILPLLQLLHLCLRQDSGPIVFWCRLDAADDLAGQVCVEIILLIELEMASGAGNWGIVSAIKVFPTQKEISSSATTKR